MKHYVSFQDVARNLLSSAELPVSVRQEREYQRRLVDPNWCIEALTEMEDAQIVALVRWLMKNDPLGFPSDIRESMHNYLWPKEDEV